MLGDEVVNSISNHILRDCCGVCPQFRGPPCLFPSFYVFVGTIGSCGVFVGIENKKPRTIRKAQRGKSAKETPAAATASSFQGRQKATESEGGARSKTKDQCNGENYCKT